MCYKKYDIGVGPDPLINNVYHKASLIGVGYKTYTFVDRVYYITDKFDLLFLKKENFISIYAEYFSYHIFMFFLIQNVFIFTLMEVHFGLIHFFGGLNLSI